MVCVLQIDMSDMSDEDMDLSDQDEEMNGVVSSVMAPKGHILDLMVKNVTLSTPLTTDETEELQAVRSLMNRHQWNDWLMFAREEKKRRDESYSDDEQEILDATHEVENVVDLLAIESLRPVEAAVMTTWSRLLRNKLEGNYIHDEFISDEGLTTSHSLSVPRLRSSQSDTMISRQRPQYHEKPSWYAMATTNVQPRATPMDVLPSKPWAPHTTASCSGTNNGDVDLTRTPINQQKGIYSTIDCPGKSLSTNEGDTTFSSRGIRKSPKYSAQGPHSVIFSDSLESVKANVATINTVISTAQSLRASLAAELTNQSIPSDSTNSALAVISSMIKLLEQSKSSLEQLDTRNKHGNDLMSDDSVSSSDELPSSYIHCVSSMNTAVRNDADRAIYTHIPSSTLKDLSPRQSSCTFRCRESSDNLYNRTNRTGSTRKEHVYTDASCRPVTSHHSVHSLYSDVNIYAHGRHAHRSMRDIPRAVKLCIVEGVQHKKCDENPFRVDIENSALDIVWREERESCREPTVVGNNMMPISSAPRQERFFFDDIYIGGESDRHFASCLEPTVSLVIGSSGGHGLMSAVVKEIFNSNTKNQPPHGNLRNLGPANAVHDTDLRQRVALTAVMISNGVVMDLLGPKAGSRVERPVQQCRVCRQSDGSYYVAHASALELESEEDFERIVGFLIGRRSTLREFAPALHEWGHSIGTSVEFPMLNNPWMLSSDCEGCILFSLNTGEDLSPEASCFRFACPCGPHWDAPGTELSEAAKAISVLPHYPSTPHCCKGILTQLLVGPYNSEIDFITIASVVESKCYTRRNVHDNGVVIKNILQSFRVASLHSSV